MEQDRSPNRAGTGGPANTPPLGDEPAVRTAADHQIAKQTGGMRASGTETERELERTRDVVAKAAAPVVAEKTQEAIAETAERLSHDPQVKEQIGRTADALKHDAQDMARQKVGQVADQARQKVNQGMGQAADRLDQAAQRLDQMADERTAGATGPKARAGSMAHSLADSIESVAGYLRSNDVDGLQRDLERQVRERPVQTLLIGVAAGWLVGKILR